MGKLFNRNISDIIKNHHDLNTEHLTSHPGGSSIINKIPKSSILLDKWLPKYGYSEFGGDV